MFPIVLVIFVAVVVWFGRQIYDFLLPSSLTVTVPSFVGQTLPDANAEIERLKLSSAVVDHTTSDRYPKDVVIMQRPGAGEQVRQGRQVSFVISDGIIARLMPDLRYQSMREVQLDLSHAHLQLGKIAYVRSDLIPEGHVVSQNPAPLVSVHEGDVVSLAVSRGARLTIPVPDFVGLSIGEARALAARAGIKLGQIVWTPLGRDAPPHGLVARQIPPPNAKIASFDPVALQVSAGPNESGYIIRQVHVLVSVPSPRQYPERAAARRKALVDRRDRTLRSLPRLRRARAETGLQRYGRRYGAARHVRQRDARGRDAAGHRTPTRV